MTSIFFCKIYSGYFCAKIFRNAQYKNTRGVLCAKYFRRYQRGRQRSLSLKTDKTMTNKMKRKKHKTHNTTMKTKLEQHEPYKN